MADTNEIIFDCYIDTQDRYRWRVISSDFEIRGNSTESYPSRDECLQAIAAVRSAYGPSRIAFDVFEQGWTEFANRPDVPILIRTKPLAAGSMPRSELIAEWCERNIPGSYVELGVFRGGTAAIFGHFAKTQGKRVHLFDTFEGLPNLSAADHGAAQYRKGQMARSVEQVKRNLQALAIDLQLFEFHAGIFTERSHVPAPVAVAHLDFDLYEGTLAGCRVIWPALSSGGAMLIHDYANVELPGCRQAVDAFEATLPHGDFSSHTERQCRVIVRRA